MKKTPPEIRILPDDVANRIAAGEVVERPAAVAKELIENSIDAGATRIEVEFKRGGKSFVKVSDDGCGMTRQQALTSLEPHATSKIRAPEDLFAISSYGFRGEAIPSIASVSKFRLRTRPESMAFGTEIDVYAGTVNSVRDCGMAAGTEISVENLFCSVPARRKFLKSDNVEASHIIRLCKLYALALPDISFTLVENSRVVFRSERGMDIVGRVGRIFGSDIAEKLFELPEISSRGISVGGAILKAGESFPTGRNICVFINGRPVDCRAAASAVKEAYSPYIPKGRFAAAFLFITLPPETVDVNVHPAKREVRLKNEFEVRDFLFDALSAALAKNVSGGIADFQKNSISLREKFSFEKPASESPAPVPAPAFTPRDTPAGGLKIREPLAVLEAPEIKPRGAASRPSPAAADVRPPLPAEPKAAPKLPDDWRYVGCFKRRFAMFETPKGILMMSISAALKRVRYEEILASLGGSSAQSQALLVPIPLKFDRGDGEYFSANRAAFEGCGFSIEDFGKNFYRITAIPAWLEYSNAENFVRDFVEVAREESRTLKKAAMSNADFARALVGRIGAASFECNAQSAGALLARLLSCANHISSPDGRAAVKEISEAELARMFG